jgi:S-adenosylmethionine/arginine decarboxylase-like enzyme
MISMRTISLLLFGALTISLAACGKKSEPVQDTEQLKAQQEASQKQADEEERAMQKSKK